jgi:hypothetical protein
MNVGLFYFNNHIILGIKKDQAESLAYKNGGYDET